MITRPFVSFLLAAVCISLLVVGCKTSPAPKQAGKSTLNRELRAELLRLQDRDTRARLQALVGNDDPAYLRRINEVDRANIKRLKELIRKHGWPTISLAGEDGAEAAGLLAGHAKADLNFMSECVELMRAAVERDDAPLGAYAHLYDKTRTEQGLPQYYGTQYRSSNGRLVPEPIEDPANVDARRQAMGLLPMKDMETRLGKEFRGRVPPAPSR